MKEPQLSQQNQPKGGVPNKLPKIIKMSASHFENYIIINCYHYINMIVVLLCNFNLTLSNLMIFGEREIFCKLTKDIHYNQADYIVNGNTKNVMSMSEPDLVELWRLVSNGMLASAVVPSF